MYGRLTNEAIACPVMITLKNLILSVEATELGANF